ncbi:MAG: hypothetical protein J6X62_01705, partial [Bacteroidales bacterium]|nr:hypothetical protein [Bacteroidales bacterium]
RLHRQGRQGSDVHRLKAPRTWCLSPSPKKDLPQKARHALERAFVIFVQYHRAHEQAPLFVRKLTALMSGATVLTEN